MSLVEESEPNAIVDIEPDTKARLPWKKLFIGVAICALILLVIAFQDEKPPSFPVFDQIRSEVDPSINPVPELKVLPRVIPPDEIQLIQGGSGTWSDAAVEAYLKSQRTSLNVWTEVLARGGTWQLEKVTDYGDPTRYLSTWSTLMRAKKLQAEQHRRKGEWLQSLELGVELIDTARHLEEADGPITTQLIALACHRRGIAVIKAAISSAGKLTEEQWSTLQRQLNSLEPDPEKFAEVFGNEYLAMLNSIPALKDGRISFGRMSGGRASEKDRFLMLFVRENKTLRHYGEAMMAFYEASRKSVATPVVMPDHLEQLCNQPNRWRALMSSNAIGNELILLVAPGFSGIQDRHVANRAQHRLLLIRIAAERFRLQEGRLPSTLEELVPDFLDAVPVDPADGAPIRYNSATGEIWSIQPKADSMKLGGAPTSDSNQVE